ncbi:MAG: hypothetical protein C0501_06565 [Isosphaera sp.]|nr:hypothetical protein [Isosphaera sp.]
MRRGGAGLIAAVLALAGCKTPSGSKPTDRDPAGTPAGRPKGKDKDKDAKGPTWLDPTAKFPGVGTSVPKGGGGPADPKDPNFDAKAAAQDALGGRVVDPAGRPAKDVFIRVEPVGAAPRPGAQLGIFTKDGGYFLASGLEPGVTYNLTAEATRDGRRLAGTVQTRVPNTGLTIVLRDAPDAPAGGDGFPPPPAPADGDRIPAAGLGPTPPPIRRPADGAFAPGGGVTNQVPATIGGAPPPAKPGGSLPPPDPSDLAVPAVPALPVVRPENVADGPKPPWQPPPVNIPPPFPKPPPSPPPPRVRPGANFRLVDGLERDWDFATGRSGSVVLLEFVTTACPHCRPAVGVLKDLQARHAAGGLQVVAVLCDEAPLKARVEGAKAYARANDVNYAVYVEPGSRPGAVRDRFGVESYPTAVLLGPDGAVLWSGHPVAKRAELEAAVRAAVGR